MNAYTEFYANNGIQWPNGYGVYRFWLDSVKNSVRQELAYYDYYMPNQPTDSLLTGTFTVAPILLSADSNATRQYSALRVNFTGYAILTTDII